MAATLPRGGDQGSLTVLISTSPAAADAVRTSALAVAAGLAQGAVTSADLDRARAPVLEGLRRAPETDAWWLATLNGSARRPEQLRDAQDALQDVERITLPEIKAEAARCLAGRPYVVKALPADPEHPLLADISQYGGSRPPTE